MSLIGGSVPGYSHYKIVQTETLVTGDVMVSLKERSALGVIPVLDESSVDELSRKPVQRALERVVNSAFRETSVSVVDQCRNAMVAVLGHYLAEKQQDESILRKDLAALAKHMVELRMEVCGGPPTLLLACIQEVNPTSSMRRG